MLFERIPRPSAPRGLSRARLWLALTLVAPGCSSIREVPFTSLSIDGEARSVYHCERRAVTRDEALVRIESTAWAEGAELRVVHDGRDGIDATLLMDELADWAPCTGVVNDETAFYVVELICTPPTGPLAVQLNIPNDASCPRTPYEE